MGKRKKTRFPGVQQRESDIKRHNGRPDVCFTIDYKDANGKRVRKDIGWASQGFTAVLASEMRNKLIYEAKLNLTPEERPQTNILTFLSAWEKYRNDWLIAKGKHSKSEDSIINKHLTTIAHLKLSEITPYYLDRLITDKKQEGLSNQTIRNIVGLIRRIFFRMAKWGFYNGPMPFSQITLPMLNNERERFLTPQEAVLLLDKLAARNREVWLMALISLHCGLRFGEIARLQWEDIRWNENTIFIPESKNGASRHAVMTETVKTALAEKKGEQGLIFPDSNGHMRKETPKLFFRVVKELGLNGPADAPITDNRQRVCFHTLRHTYASWLAKSGQGQLTIADRLGHRSLAMTRRYTHLMDETRKASAQAIENIFHSIDQQ